MPKRYVPYVITDFGRNYKLTCKSGETSVLVPRYGVWAHDPQNPEREEVIATNDDLDILKSRYGDLPVVKFETENFFREVPEYPVDE